jgi:hypothetical protein
VIAGFGAGFTESLLAVTPFESIKTQLFVVTSFEYLPVVRATNRFQGGATDIRETESTIESPQILVCVDSCTAVRSSFRKEAFAAFFKASFLQRQDRRPTRRPDSQATQC